MSHTYNKGQNVVYNSQFCTVCRLRTVDSQPAYLLREIHSGLSHDNVLESNVSSCDVSMIINEKWSEFNYDGDNSLASSWIFNNIIKNIGSGNNISWGSNNDNTVYSLTVSGQTWNKDKTTSDL